ncbi:MAG TPA: hypothetical protein V6C81_06850 [Planktothrix sp.]|jgi:hypothetical protein
MDNDFHVSCDMHIWTISRNGLIFAEHEMREDAVSEATKLARRAHVKVVLHGDAQPSLAPVA